MEPAISSDMVPKTTRGYRWGYLAVALSVGAMTAFDASPATLGPTARLAYDEVASPGELHADCEAVGRALPRPGLARTRLTRAAASSGARAAHRPGEVPESAQRLANALHLHLD